MRTTLLTIATLIALTAHGLCADATPSPTPQPDKLKDALAELITGVTQTASDAKSFVVAQLPDVVRQLLAWKLAESIATMIWRLAVLIAAIKLLFKFRHYAQDSKWKFFDEEDEGKGFGECFSYAISHIAVGITTLWFLCGINLTWLQIWIAPKVYLIEFAKDLIHK